MARSVGTGSGSATQSPAHTRTEEGTAFEEGTEYEEGYEEVPRQRLIVTNDGLLDPSLLLKTEGYISKKGGTVNARGGFRSWRKRWFKLVEVEDFLADGSDHVGYELEYWTSPKGKQKGIIGLADVEIYCDERPEGKRKGYEFQILLQNGSLLELSCDDQTEMEEWVETLHMVITYLRYLRRMLTAQGAYTGIMQLDGYDPLREDEEESFKIGEELSRNCQAYGPGIFGSEAGCKTQFVVQVHDLLGQQTTRGGMPITATITNEECLYYLKIQDNADGTYLAFYVLSRAGKYKLNICLNDEHHIFGSPFEIEILPTTTVANKCAVEGDAVVAVTAKTAQTFTIIAHDCYGNQKQRGGDPFEVGLMGPAQLKRLQDNLDGTYTCEIEALSPNHVNYVSAASLLILVTLNGKHIKGSPFKPSILESVKPIIRYSSPGRRGLSPSSPSPSSSLIGSNRNRPSAGVSPDLSTKLAQTYPVSSPTVSSPPFPGRVSPSADSAAHLGNQGGARNSRSSVVSVALSQASTNARPTVEQQTQQPQQQQQPAPANSSEARLRAPSAPMSTPAPSRGPSVPQFTPSPAQLASELAPTTSASGQPLSRLERARQRALLAKSLTEQQQELPPSASQNQKQVKTSVPRPREAPESTGNARMQVSDLDSNSREVQEGAASRSNNKLNMIAARSMQNLNKLKSKTQAEASTAAAPSSSSQSHVPFGRASTGHGLSAQEQMVSIVDAELSAKIQQGLVGVPPSMASVDEQRVWDSTHRGLAKREVAALLTANLPALRQLFYAFAQRIEGENVIKLSTSSNGGVYKLCELYELVPTYVSRIEAKIMFSLLVQAQENAGSAGAHAGGGSGLDFEHFLKYLVMMAYHCFSKTKSFSTMYGSIEAKVEAMLHKWGLADEVKFQVIQPRIPRVNDM